MAGAAEKLMSGLINKGNATPVVPKDLKAFTYEIHGFTKMDEVISKVGMDEFMRAVVSRINPETVSYRGAEDPVTRRKSLMGRVTADALIVLIAGTEFRGHKFGNYASKNDESAKKFKECMMVFGMRSGTKSTSFGNLSVIGAKVAFSDFFIAFCGTRKARFGDKVYGGPCPPEYQWLGSLSSMYHPDEDSKGEMMRLTYMEMYEDFQEWYIKVRAEAAAAQGNTKAAPSRDSIELQKNIQRTYYGISLKSFSLETRKGWFNKNPNTVVSKGVDIVGFDDVVKQKFGITAEKWAEAKNAVKPNALKEK